VSERVLFLDIDGPMIPTTMMLGNPMASFERKFPATTIGAVNYLCKKSGAKIVLNTTHNISHDDVPDIEIALAEHGLNPDHFHEDIKTSYPVNGRGGAVAAWLSTHPGVDWLAFDDARFIENDRLIWIDPDQGITTAHVNQALQQWGVQGAVILI
jgi:hypothetical protein